MKKDEVIKNEEESKKKEPSCSCNGCCCNKKVKTNVNGNITEKFGLKESAKVLLE